MFFDLIDVKLVNSHLVYTKLGNDISLLNFKIFMAKAFIGGCTNCKRSFPVSRPSKRKYHKESMPRKVSVSMPEC